MSSGQKVVLSFLLTIVFFAGFIVLDNSTDFSIKEAIQTKFYAQAKIQEKQEQLDTLTQNYNNYISDILSKVYKTDDSLLQNSSVKTYAIQNPTEKDELTRRNLTNQIFDEIPSFEGIRLIEKNKRAVHYSSFASDILKIEGSKKTYKNYPNIQEENKELLVDDITTDAKKEKYYLDKTNKRLIISFPFYTNENLFFGSFVCYFNLNALETEYKNKGLILQENSFELITTENQNALILNIPRDGKKEFNQAIINALSNNNYSSYKLNKIIEQENGKSWVLLVSKNSKDFIIGQVYESSNFELAKEFSLLIYISVFITLFLLFFLCFNLRGNSLVRIKQRIKKIQFGIVSEYLENKQEIEWNQVARELANRKEELYIEIKHSIGKNKKHEKLVDEFLESSWQEIINIISKDNQQSSNSLNIASIQEIRKVIEEVIQEAKLNLSPVVTQVVASPSVQANVSSKVEPIDDIAELDEVEDLSPIEEEVGELLDVDNTESLENEEEILELEEFIETQEDAAEDDDDFTKSILANINANELILVSGAAKNLILSREAYSFEATDDFATCTSLFAEDLCIGSEYVQNQTYSQKDFEFTTYEPEFLVQNEDNCFEQNTNTNTNIEEREQVELVELSEPIDELVPMENQVFSMTSFNQNNIPVSEYLEESAIIEENGVYQISKELSNVNAEINQDFKKLADSVLNFKK